MKSSQATKTRTPDHCASCGAALSGGREGCQQVFDNLAARIYTEPVRAGVHPLAFDTYCMQHPDKYCASAKSYAAHLTRLCCGLELEGNQGIYRAIPAWLSGAAPVAKPEVPDNRGTLTVASVAEAEGDEYVRLVQAWARNVWDAYAHQHALAREWIAMAMEHQRGHP